MQVRGREGVRDRVVICVVVFIYSAFLPINALHLCDNQMTSEPHPPPCDSAFHHYNEMSETIKMREELCSGCFEGSS